MEALTLSYPESPTSQRLLHRRHLLLWLQNNDSWQLFLSPQRRGGNGVKGMREHGEEGKGRHLLRLWLRLPDPLREGEREWKR